ncbi:MAG: outer membrane protein assembly factor BamC, partial [Venatoribacter sp.]
MLLRVLLIASLVLSAGCSWLQNTDYRDRSFDYLKAQEQPQTQAPEDLKLQFADRYVIPDLDVVPPKPEKFVVPAPAPLSNLDDEDGSATLSQYRAEELEPRLEHDGAGGLILRLNGSYAQAWSKVTDAIADSSIKMTDLNRSIGTWYIEIERIVKAEDRNWWARMWGKDKKVTETYMLKMNRARLGVYVSLIS